MRLRIFASAVVLFFSIPSVGFATPVLTVQHGQLLGASRVLVNDTLYNVAFQVGTCADVFDGCDALSDFTFQSGADVDAANVALLEQVLIDGPGGDFDSAPSLTSGCLQLFPHGSTCAIFTPFDPVYNLDPVLAELGGKAFSLHNTEIEQLDELSHELMFFNREETERLWAVWTTTKVPEPSTGLLLLIGVLPMLKRRS